MAVPKTIQSVYTDGACSGNPGPGGWGTVIYFADGSVQELGGGEPQTTNNRMEMQAAIEALEYLVASSRTEPVALYTDSEYVKNGITKWLSGWKKKGWKTAAGKPVLNQDLWHELDSLQVQVAKQAPLEWRYVKGHSGDRGNDRCDEIARAFSLGQKPKLRQAALEKTEPVSEPVSKLVPEPKLPRESEPKVMPESQPESQPQAQPESQPEALQSNHEPTDKPTNAADTLDDRANMVDSVIPDAGELPRDVTVAQLRNVLDTLHMADELARQGYLITSSELADLMDVNASAVTSRGDNWVWRNWVISRVRREGNQILWQLERVD